MGKKLQKYSHTAEQDIWIYYGDVGLMDTPAEQPETQAAESDEQETILTEEAIDDASAATAVNTDPAA